MATSNLQSQIDKALTSLINIARDTIGHHLAKQKGPGGNLIPSVIKARQNGLDLNHPYVVVDLLGTMHTDEPVMSTTMTEPGVIQYHTGYKLLLRYDVYGGNALAIATDLNSWFSTSPVLNKIICDTQGGGLEEVLDITPMHRKQATEYIEGARFDLTINVPVVLTTHNEGYFDSITINGEVTQQGSPNSTEFTINLPENNGE